MKKTYLKIKPLALAIAALGATFATPAAAFKFEMENGITGSFDSTISFGMQTRLQSPDKSIIGRDNGGTVATTSEVGEKVNPGIQGPPIRISTICRPTTAISTTRSTTSSPPSSRGLTNCS